MTAEACSVSIALYAMKRIAISILLLGLIPSVVLSSGAWGPDLIEFDLEGGSKKQAMMWLSGFSYSSTELLQLAGCLEKVQYIESKELIEVLNSAFSGKRVTSEAASGELGRYISSNYACAAYNKNLHQSADAQDE
jgi:hypothetical protein